METRNMDIKKVEGLLGVWIWNTSFILLCILSLVIIIILFHYLPGNFFTTKAPHLKKLCFIQFNEAFYKIPIFMVVLNYESMNCLIKYVNSREDIKKKNKTVKLK